MVLKYKLSIQKFCETYQVEKHFVIRFVEANLIELTRDGNEEYISEDQVPKLEKMVRLHRDLDINEEGLEAIAHLLNRIEGMNNELVYLRNRLNLYEE